jgi:murein DD-endopeptidase MepM/ murein hydrolase activator NlpD
MNKSFFLKKRISAFLAGFALSVVRFSTRLYKLIFTKRTILFVTNEKIRSVTLGPVLQACIFLFIAWVANLFIQSLHYNKLIGEKVAEIDKLKTVNSYFSSEFEDINEKLKKVNEYLVSVTGGSHNVSAEDHKFKDPKKFKEDDLSRRDKHTLNQVKDAEFQLASIEVVAKTRIKKIEKAISLTGLNIKPNAPKSLRSKSKLQSSNNYAKGGPDENDTEIEKALAVQKLSSGDEESLERHMEKLVFNSEIDYLMVLEKLALVMPLSRPMKNHIVSSGFGKRVDPITGRVAVHQGLDFIGVNRAKIISPSQGKVILAGQFSGYGNAVVIDHGFGITTRYGHLSALKVKPGQFVKKGEVIALQGNTGRSTGAHLHYEVRYRGTPLNPRKFIDAGEALFNNERKYANS